MKATEPMPKDKSPPEVKGVSVHRRCYEVKNHRGEPSLPAEHAMMFPVIGAGYLAIRFNYISHCGTAQGASVDASWSKYGYSGGVMEIEDMIELKKQIETYVNDFGTKEQKTLMNSSS